MRKLPEDVSIGIFGHYGNENMGDESIVTAVIQNIRQRLPQATLTCLSLVPEDTAARYGVPSYPIHRFPTPVSPSDHASESNGPTGHDTQTSDGPGQPSLMARLRNALKTIPILSPLLKAARDVLLWPAVLRTEFVFLRGAYRILKGLDVLMITGSNQFLDNFGGPWGFPYRLLKWSALAKMAGTRVIYVSVGAGPVSAKLSKVLIRSALLFSDYTSFRDLPSQKLVESMGFKGPSSVYPDLAFSLFREDRSAASHPEEQSHEGPIRVGINVMPVYSNRYWCIHDSEKYLTYVRTLARFAAMVLRDGSQVFFWGTQKRDEGAIEDVLAYLKEEPGVSVDVDSLTRMSRSVSELMQVIDGADIMVTTRFHGAVLSLFAEKAVLGVCYYRKTDDLMKEMGQGDYTMDFETLDAEQMFLRLKQLEHNRAVEIPKISRTTAEYKQALTEQYDTLFGPAPEGRTAVDERQLTVREATN